MTQDSENEEDTPSLGVAMEEALDWFTRLRAPGTNSAEQQEFQYWLSANEENAAAYRKVEQLWSSPALTQAVNTYANNSLPRSPEFLEKNHARIVKSRFAAIAAIVMLSVSLLFYSDLWLRLRSDYYTMTGTQKTVTLADGSSIILNTGSALAVDYQPSHRSVYLLKGEAYFDVRHDVDRPFEVHTQDAIVKVLGTRFTVRSGAQEMVTVLNGTVAYRQPQNDNSLVLITKGQRLSATANEIDALQSIDVDHDSAWLRGRLVFRDLELAEAITEVERYLPGKVIVTNSQLATSRVTGNYKLQDPQAIIRALAETAGAQITQLSPYLTVLH